MSEKSRNFKRNTEKDSTKLSVNIHINGIGESDLMKYLKSAPAIKPNKSNGRPFGNLDYDKIIAYDFKGDEKTFDAAIDKNGKFIPIIEKQQFLSQNQADEILKIPARKHRVFNKGTEDEYFFTGFTPYGKNALNNLCGEIGFYYKNTTKK